VLFHRRAPGPVVLLFAATLFVSAFLLFLVEPIVARMILPILGGAPMVWNGCVLFFQCMLLAGYAYAHGSHRWLGPRPGAAAYLALLFAPFAFLPFVIAPGSAPAQGHPLGWLFLVLLGSIGAPFFVLASSTSVLQKVFARTGTDSARDPYFLYIASNAGSLLGLLSYPLFVEPALSLRDQSRLWTMGYGGFVVLALVCVTTAWRMVPRHATAPGLDDPHAAADPPLTLARRLRWVALAAIPSSLMLGVTGYLTTDIASFPLLWVVPLALYLVTFMLAFARPAYWRALADRRLPIGVVTVAVFILLNVGAPVWLVVPVHLGTFVLAGLLCHSALADDRPPASQLTEFYLWIAVGGAIGGLFNTLVAPMLFNSVAEYPIALVLAACLRDQPRPGGWRALSPADFLIPGAISAVAFASIAGTHHFGMPPKVAFYLPALLCFQQLRHVPRFAMAVAVLLLVGSLTPYATIYGQVLLARRTFFGVYRISRDPSGRYYWLHHGTTLHGLAAIDPAGANEPLAYYHRAGPIGQAMFQLPHVALTPEVAVVGLGIGALASYGGPAQHWTFYEIDPAVEQLARDTRFFSYLSACGPRCAVVIGDARLSMARSRAGQYGLIVLDAFSSDAIPVHLLTTEAVALYLSRLAPDGVLAFHISNRHLRLGSILGRLAAAHGLTAREQVDSHAVDIDERGMTTSDWLVMAKRPEDLGSLIDSPRWAAPRVPPATPLWTDDFSNILSVFNFRE
jgi:hypothetical protein